MLCYDYILAKFFIRVNLANLKKNIKNNQSYAQKFIKKILPFWQNLYKI
jgi:hypothetical protein